MFVIDNIANFIANLNSDPGAAASDPAQTGQTGLSGVLASGDDAPGGADETGAAYQPPITDDDASADPSEDRPSPSRSSATPVRGRGRGGNNYGDDIARNLIDYYGQFGRGNAGREWPKMDVGNGSSYSFPVPWSNLPTSGANQSSRAPGAGFSSRSWSFDDDPSENVSAGDGRAADASANAPGNRAGRHSPDSASPTPAAPGGDPPSGVDPDSAGGNSDHLARLTSTSRMLERARQSAAVSGPQTTERLHALGVPLIDADGVPIDLNTADPQAVEAQVNDAFDRQLDAADATARRSWSFDSPDVTGPAPALRADVERRRAQALAALGRHWQTLQQLPDASDAFDQARAAYMAGNIRDLQAINARRAAGGQAPVPIPDEWQRLAALLNPQRAQSTADPRDPANVGGASTGGPIRIPGIPDPPVSAFSSPGHIPGIPDATSAGQLGSRSSPDTTPNVATDLVNRIVLGGFHDLERAAEGTSRFVGLNGLADWYKNQADLREKQLAGQVFNGTDQYINPNANAISRTSGNVGGGLLANVPSMAMGRIPGLLEMAIQSMARASATAHDAAKAQGASDEEATDAARAAALNTLPQTAVYALTGRATGGLLKNILPLNATPLTRAAMTLVAGIGANLVADALGKFIVGENPRPTVDDLVNSIVFSTHGAMTARAMAQNVATARAILDGTHPDVALMDGVAQGKVSEATAEQRNQASQYTASIRAVAASFLRKAGYNTPSARPDTVVPSSPPRLTAEIPGLDAPGQSPDTPPISVAPSGGDSGSPGVGNSDQSVETGDSQTGMASGVGKGKAASADPDGNGNIGVFRAVGTPTTRVKASAQGEDADGNQSDDAPGKTSKIAERPASPVESVSRPEENNELTFAGSSPYQVHIDPNTRRGPMAVDTSVFTSGRTTMRGGIRESRQFWKAWAGLFPDTLSLANSVRINSRRAPIVDPKWVETFPEHAGYPDDVLIHHHLDYGPNAIPIPNILHGEQPGWGEWHSEHSGRSE